MVSSCSELSLQFCTLSLRSLSLQVPPMSVSLGDLPQPCEIQPCLSAVYNTRVKVTDSLHLVDVAQGPIQRCEYKMFLRHTAHALRVRRPLLESTLRWGDSACLFSIWEEVSKYSGVRKKLALVTRSPFCDWAFPGAPPTLTQRQAQHCFELYTIYRIKGSKANRR